MTANMTDGNKICSLSSFERNAYFYGKLLTVRDFQAEQQYFMDKGRVAHRLLHGPGIVCGLKAAAPAITNNQLVIDLGEGYALDCCGREIVVPTPGQQLKVEGKCQTGKNYLYLEYYEKKREPTLTPDGSADSEAGSCNYGRILELYKLSITATAPARQAIGLSMEQPGEGPGTTSPCSQLAQQYYQKNLDKCPECIDAGVFLAVVDIEADGSAKINPEETTQYRSIVYSNPLLRDLLCGHLADFTNPHHTTAGSIGALTSVANVESPGGNIDLIGQGAIEITPNIAAKSITVSESHSPKTDNPHQTTAAQVGALVSVKGIENPGGNIDLISQGTIQITANEDAKSITIGETHSTILGNPHQTTAAQVGALASVKGVQNPGGDIDLVGQDAIEVSANPADKSIIVRETHSSRTDNPHQTTAAQVGALVSVEGVGNPGGNIGLIAQSAIRITVDKAAKSITVGENHSTKTTNPHRTTAAQVGALASVKGMQNPGGDIDLISPDGSINITPDSTNHSINLTIAELAQAWPVITKISWVNDQPLSGPDFNQGLEVTFSEPMHPDTITLDTFVVTIELPTRDVASGLPGYHSLILYGIINPDDEYNQVWRFKPTPEVTDKMVGGWLKLQKEIFSDDFKGDDQLRCRVVLKGNAILDAKGQRPLDGDAFGAISGGAPFTQLTLSSGDRRKGGDFESWFYLKA